MQDSGFETARDACRRLNVSSQTLYAYVSRGLVRTAYHPDDSRKRLYASIDIEQLLNRQTRGRSRRAIARSTIDFGEPILQSSVSSIKDGQFYYRGHNAVELSKVATLEDVFALLCETKVSNAPMDQSYVSSNRIALSRFVDALAQQLVNSSRAHGNKQTALKLLRLMASNAAKQNAVSPQQAIHQQLADAWTSDSRAPDLIRRALVLSADHELNASTYATRVTASTGASLSACLLTGVSALSGEYHGGLTDLCLAWMRESAKQGASAAIASINGTPPGFGHRLYPNGDPRATEIISGCPPPKSWSHIAKRVLVEKSEHPTLDYGLATLEHQLKLPKGAGFSIFAVGRTVGWLAHCFEQRKSGALIRPRASNQS